MTNKKDIGNLHNALGTGVDLDPQKKLELHQDKEKGQKAYYNGKEMKYMDYMQEVTNRVKRNKNGKGANNIGIFSVGVSFDDDGNIIR